MKKTFTQKISIATMLLSFLMLSGLHTFSQTPVSGIISSNTSWTTANSPYIITGNVLLDSGYTLTIQPGVIVKFDSLKCLQIGGTLTAIGTSSNPITFTSNQTNHVAGYWGYVLFNETSVGYDTITQTGSVLQYCTIEYGGNQNLPNSSAVIRSDLINLHTQDLTLPFIDHCIIRNNTTTGIKIYGSTAKDGSLLRITNCELYNNINPMGAGGGINVYIGSIASNWSCTALISKNKIHDNNGGSEGGGILCGTQGGYGNVYDNLIYNNTADIGGGIYCGAYNGWSYDVQDNIIFHNTANDASAIYLYGGIAFKNVIANNVENTSNSTGRVTYATDAAMHNNTIIDNTAFNNVVYFASGLSGGGYWNYNTITRNRVTELAPTTAISIGDFYPVMRHDNIYGNATTFQLVDLIAQGGDNVDARNCWWGTTSNVAINNAIVDYFDNPALSMVTCLPALSSPDTTAPVTPVVNVIKTDLGGGNIQITWDANPEVDIAGYKVYWGSATGYSFSHSNFVGNTQTTVISGASINDTIAVTALDIFADGTLDQQEGHESWFSYAIGKPSPAFTATPLSVCQGDTVHFTANTPNLYPYANTSWAWSFTGGSPNVSSAQNPLIIYNNPGTYPVKLVVTNIAGKDSLTMTNYITVSSRSYSVITPNVCNTGYYTSPSGLYTWYSNGIYQDTIPNHAGCDSVITIHLTLNTESYNTIAPEACRSYVSPSGKHTWTISNNYLDTIPNHAGCDSVITINLTVVNIDTAVTGAGNTLTANATGLNYQWLNCGSGYSIIGGETNQSFTPSVTGDYAVRITEGICVDTSYCYNITIVGIAENSPATKVNFYPNPVDQLLNIEFGKVFNHACIQVLDYTGRIIKTISVEQTDKAIIDCGNFANGIYMMRIMPENGKTTNFNVVKN